MPQCGSAPSHGHCWMSVSVLSAQPDGRLHSLPVNPWFGFPFPRTQRVVSWILARSRSEQSSRPVSWASLKLVHEDPFGPSDLKRMAPPWRVDENRPSGATSQRLSIVRSADRTATVFSLQSAISTKGVGPVSSSMELPEIGQELSLSADALELFTEPKGH